ncbi:TetR/AcrR family transcriptional regulator [Mycobacterium haemophilum]|uniref:TetR family transcriptional regulator n=1 Tax=Mycobacterium haemophilum TaxID=29311 RepID=A0A0I9UD17_9MYCO|nr:TetR/AcrR family transcriptional regulator [Mycobacterium haemophilum]AKN18748.1 TetR family transcriptional regulator [Mycobacterium haemophilum DSM 44634]KLO27787.1 TetR family transcriptional regulator [Mycobacterium haemophilum]KLO35295.1 TetR family transcriptional regulator [Mycobacterium haemophilum]KLO40306.1 TetR family transcriptional regulator [Mycobacterium haemophilum]KLO47580.1 TetR family transcriptional regulator [Mycobacterium haemophilum]
MSNQPAQTGYAPASRGRRPSRTSGDDRQQAILATAERLLKERPLADFSVGDLAKGAGISRPTFYFYFPSKNAVLLSLLDQLSSKAHAALDGEFSGDPTTAWRARIEAFFEVSGSHPGAGAAAEATTPEMRQLWLTLMQSWISHTTAAIEAKRQRGTAPDSVAADELAIPHDRVIDTLVHVWLASIYDR